MAQKIIDLRSDTVTRPTPGMRRAMAEAEVGDDVYGEDPTVNRLQERSAALLGKEAGLFVTSGSMGNLVSIKVQTEPGDEIVGDADCHVFNFELGAAARLAGVMPRAVVTPRGFLVAEDLKRAIRPDIYYLCRTRLVVLENTHNLKGGSVYPVELLHAVTEFAHREGLAVHLDGARIFNAALACGTAPAELVGGADSVSFCFSKGLGAPVGSMIVGSRGLIDEARRVRKALGGGMRQAGVLAAACEWALDHHVERLVEDHVRARRLGARLEALGVELEPVETNIVTARFGDRAAPLARTLESHGVRCSPFGDKIRFVTHLDVGDEDVRRVERVFEEVLR